MCPSSQYGKDYWIVSIFGKHPCLYGIQCQLVYLKFGNIYFFSVADKCHTNNYTHKIIQILQTVHFSLCCNKAILTLRFKFVYFLIDHSKYLLLYICVSIKGKKIQNSTKPNRKNQLFFFLYSARDTWIYSEVEKKKEGGQKNTLVFFWCIL